jgi:hypothetical protein
MKTPLTRPLAWAYFLAAFASLTPSTARADEPTRIFSACTDDERIRFNDSFPEKDRAWAATAISDKPSGPEMYKAGFHLAQSKTSWEVREIGEYLKGRAYYQSGLVHIAYEKFQALAALPLMPGVPIVGRHAAIQCMLKIQSDFPPLAFGGISTQNLTAWLQRKELDNGGRQDLGRALILRMKELMNHWDEAEANQIIAALGNMPGYAVYAQALVAQRSGQYGKAVPLWERLIDKGELPSEFNADRDTSLILYARDLYEQKQYDKAADVLRKVPRDSNYLAQALSDLSWALLQANKRPEAIGAAFNIQKSLLTRVYAPEAPLVASIALHEMCQYARALKNAVFFKKKYYPVLIWYNKLSDQQKTHPYELLTAALRKKGGVPNLVLLEWLRSPEYRAFQIEANLLFDERKTAYHLYGQRVNAEKGAPWLREWKAPLPVFYNQIGARQKRVGSKMNGVLIGLTNRMARQVAKMAENVQLLEVEIFDYAGEDMVWRNVNPEYQAWVDEQPEEGRDPNKFWEWGSVTTDPKHIDEVWEDELGYTVASVPDECKNRERYKKQKFGPDGQKKQAGTAAAPAGG